MSGFLQSPLEHLPLEQQVWQLFMLCMLQHRTCLLCRPPCLTGGRSCRQTCTSSAYTTKAVEPAIKLLCRTILYIAAQAAAEVLEDLRRSTSPDEEPVGEEEPNMPQLTSRRPGRHSSSSNQATAAAPMSPPLTMEADRALGAAEALVKAGSKRKAADRAEAGASAQAELEGKSLAPCSSCSCCRAQTSYLLSTGRLLVKAARRADLDSPAQAEPAAWSLTW